MTCQFFNFFVGGQVKRELISVIDSWHRLEWWNDCVTTTFIIWQSTWDLLKKSVPYLSVWLPFINIIHVWLTFHLCCLNLGLSVSAVCLASL